MAEIAWNPFDADELSSRWSAVIKVCEGISREAASLLFVARPISVMRSGHIVLVCLRTRYPFHQTRMMSAQLRPSIEAALQRVLGAVVAVDVQLEETEDKSVNAANFKQRPASRPVAPTAVGRRGSGYSHRQRSGPIRAIPTTYAGIQFRSKLEANTAKLFDSADVYWQYETEGYDLFGVWYLPDFYLPDCRTFVEVKGILDHKSVEKVERLAVACASESIAVVMLRDLRLRPVEAYMTVIGDWVTPSLIEADNALFVRCPICQKVSWIRRGTRTCPHCAHTVKATHQFERVY